MSAGAYPQIVITGDSIAQNSFAPGGSGFALSEAYQGKMDVMNRGMGGYNSRQLLQKFRDTKFIAGQLDVRLFIIHIGTNDSAVLGFAKVGIEEYKSNLTKIMEYIRDVHPNAGIVLVTPATIDLPAYVELANRIDPTGLLAKVREAGRTRIYARTAIEVAKRFSLPSVDAYSLFENSATQGTHLAQELFLDGVHYSAKGYRLIISELLRAIHGHYPHISPDSVPEAFDSFAKYGTDHQDPLVQQYLAQIDAVNAARRTTVGKPWWTKDTSPSP